MTLEAKYVYFITYSFSDIFVYLPVFLCLIYCPKLVEKHWCNASTIKAACCSKKSIIGQILREIKQFNHCSKVPTIPCLVYKLGGPKILHYFSNISVKDGRKRRKINESQFVLTDDVTP